MAAGERKDLIVLVPDNNIEFAVRGLLSRPKSLGIRAVQADVFVHPQRDPGCFLRADQFLRPFANQYDRALVIFDREGAGRETQTREQLEADLEKRLSNSGWHARASVIVIDPELEVWVWSDSPHVDEILGWSDHEPRLRSWLLEHDFQEQGDVKPARPKEAVEQALRAVGKPRSSALYERLAKSVSLERCADPAFSKFKKTIYDWFRTT